MNSRRQFLRTVAVVAGASTLQVNAQTSAAAAYPSKPIRLIIPYAPGGTTDILGRRLGQRLSEMLGQPVVVDNRAGGNTGIGAEMVAKSPADGHTLLFTNDSTFVLNPVLFQSLPYDMQRDFVPVASVAYAALGLVVSSATPANNMQELAAYARSRKDLSYGSFGAGSQPHLMGEMFKQITKADLVHVPYRGAGPAVTDVLGGQILFTFPAFPTVQGHLATGRLKMLGVSGAARLPVAPNVPTFTESGFADMDIGGWYVMFAPAGTPPDIVAKVNGAIGQMLADKAFADANLTSQGLTVMPRTPQELPGAIRSEIERMRSIVQKSGAKVE